PIVAAVSDEISVVRYGIGTSESPETLPTLTVIGIHQRLNAAGARAAATALGIERSVAEMALADFRGVGRRLEYIGQRNGIDAYDGYGHHPPEVKATLAALKGRYPDRRLVVACQPHQHSRVQALFDDFVTSFADADRLLLADVYAVPGRDESVVVEAP